MLSHYGVGQKRKWVQAALRRPSSTVTVRGRPSPEKLLRVFYSPKLWVCRGGAFPALAVRHDVTSHGREIRWSTLQGRVGGGFDSANLKTNKDAFGVCFFFFILSVLSIKHRALLNPPRFDMAPSSVMGCLAQGMYLWPLFWVQEVHGPAGSSWDWIWKFLPLQVLHHCLCASRLQ